MAIFPFLASRDKKRIDDVVKNCKRKRYNRER